MAAFENKTIGEIRDLIINSIQTKFNIAFRMLSKSFIRVIATVFAGVYIVLYKQIGWVFLQLFPETAYWDEVNILGFRVSPLVKWGNLIGVGDPKTGTQWQGTIAVTVTTAAGTLIAGTQLKSDITGKLYITEESVPLDADTVSVPVICAENGSAGSLDAGDILSFVNPLGNAQKTAAVQSVVKYPRDDETESEYRARVASRFRNPPLGGALSDYRRWASDVEGVLNAYPYKDTGSPSGVLIYVAGTPSLFPDRIPSADLLVQVGEACTYDPETGAASRKPVTAVIDPKSDGSYENVLPVSIIGFNVYITGVAGVPVDDFASAARPAIENYFLGREPYIRGLSDDNNVTKIVSRNNVSSVVDQAAVSVKAEFESVTMQLGNDVIPVYTLGQGELAKLNNLYINGALV
jgi:uncharacterized phage protein gp47/JayE